MKLFNSKKEKKKAEAKKKDPKYQVELGELMRLASEQPALRAIFYERLWNENVFVLIANQGIPEGKLDDETAKNIQIIKLPDGRVPVFTSLQRVTEGNNIRANISYLSIKGENLFIQNPELNYVINPWSKYGKNITPEEISKIDKGEHLYDVSTSSNISPEDGVQIIVPEKYPAKLMDDLIVLYREFPEVDRAYIALLKYNDSKRSPNYVVCLMVDESFDHISTETGIIADKHLLTGQILQVMELTKESHFWNFFRHRKPFYRRDVN